MAKSGNSHVGGGEGGGEDAEDGNNAKIVKGG